MDHLLNMKSLSHESKPSRNKLQEVTTYKFDWEENWYPIEFKSGKMALSRDKFYFLFNFVKYVQI